MAKKVLVVEDLNKIDSMTGSEVMKRVYEVVDELCSCVAYAEDVISILGDLTWLYGQSEDTFVLDDEEDDEWWFSEDNNSIPDTTVKTLMIKNYVKLVEKTDEVVKFSLSIF